METNKTQWVSPSLCDAPHRIVECERLYNLIDAFLEGGWDLTKPCMIGYWLNDRIQLLSGSHRYEAAVRAKLEKVPVIVRTLSEVQDAYGDLDKWSLIMNKQEEISL